MTILFDGRFATTPNFSLYNRVDRDLGGGDVPPISGGVLGSYEIVTDPVGTDPVAKISVASASPGRCEIRPNFRDIVAAGPDYGELWYAWWDLFPGDWADELPGVADPGSDLISSTKDIIAQGHGAPDGGDLSHLPQFALYVQQNRLRFARTYDTNATTTTKAPNLTLHGSWPLVKMKWIEWVLHVNWCASSNGFFHLYKDRRMVYTQTAAPNCYNDSEGPFFKIGFYKYFGSLSPATRVRYTKGIVIGNSSSSFLEVTGHASLENATIRGTS